MDDAIAVYREASAANDIDGLLRVPAPDAELHSPVASRMVFRGSKDPRVLLGAVYSTTRDLRWTEEIGDGPKRVLIGECRIGPLRMTDAMAFDLDAEGRIRRIRPHLRPWLALTLFALILLVKVGAHPRVVLRAARG